MLPLVCRVQQTLANKENVCLLFSFKGCVLIVYCKENACLLFFFKGCVLIVSGGLIESSADPGAGWER